MLCTLCALNGHDTKVIAVHRTVLTIATKKIFYDLV
jgi:hypothetical protein